jgi:hypothetical protein
MKQNAINAIAELYLNGSLSPSYLYQYITNKEMLFDEWQISSFALM